MSKKKLDQSFWIKWRYPLIYIPLFLCGLLLYVPYVILVDSYSMKIRREVKVEDTNTGYFVKTIGCRIPFLDAFDKSIIKYVYKQKPFNCNNNKLPLVESNMNTIYINEQQLSNYNISNQDFKCSYQPFWRKDPKTNISDNLYTFGNKTSFNSSAKISDEFVKVICTTNNGTVIYTDFHSFVPIKKSTNKTKETINILVIGLDSLSRLNFYRQLPHTKNYLTKLNAIEMFGYNKVGDNTFPNLIPILTGQTVDEIKKGCWPTIDAKFDKCNFIWKNYSEAGYLTSYAEDASWMGIFNYLKAGFMKQPTDYYWRTFNFLAEKQIGHKKIMNTDLCMGPRATYNVLLQYIQKYVFSLRKEKYFGFFWESSLTHDDLNYPNQGDNDHRLFLQNITQFGVLNNTLLIFVSDHGIRWGEIRSTHQGQLEERLPYLYFVFPQWFKSKYPTAVANIMRNSKRLTTPFDLHETLVDLLNMETITTKNIKLRSMKLYNKRGISLFLPIPINRTCLSANISMHWCTCQKSVQVNKTESIIQSVAQFIVDYMNKLLKDYQSCVPLKLNSIEDARLTKTPDYLQNKTEIHDYTVIIKTEPNEGLFEATVRCVKCNSNDDLEMTGTISRLNLYGKQSACITEYHLKKYCYCAR